MHELKQPIYQMIQDHIKHKIVSGEWKPGDKIPTEKELMEQFDVSRITVSNALALLVKGGWVNRIQGRGSYVLGVGEQEQQTADAASPADSDGKRQRKNGLIGLILPSLSDFFSLRLHRGIAKAVRESGCSMVMMLSDNSTEREAAAIRELLAMGVSGLIIFPVDAETYNEEILRLKLQRYPFVIIDRYLSGIDTHYIGSDGVEGGRLAVTHLYDAGHRDIAICSDVPLSTTSVEQRLSGYMKGLKERGEKINPALMLTEFYVNYDQDRLDEHHPLFRYVKNGLATAYITLNGNLALHLRKIAAHLGLAIPNDFSVLTFDNPMPSREFNFFAYIDQHESEVGERSVKLLLELLDEAGTAAPADSKYQKIVLEPHLVPGLSSIAFKDTVRKT